MDPLRSSQSVRFTEVEPQFDFSRYNEFKALYEDGISDRFQLSEQLQIDVLLVGRYVSRYRMEKYREVLNKPPRFEMQ